MDFRARIRSWKFPTEDRTATFSLLQTEQGDRAQRTTARCSKCFGVSGREVEEIRSKRHAPSAQVHYDTGFYAHGFRPRIFLLISTAEKEGELCSSSLAVSSRHAASELHLHVHTMRIKHFITARSIQTSSTLQRAIEVCTGQGPGSRALIRPGPWAGPGGTGVRVETGFK